MICGRCDRAIRPGEKYTVHDILSPTGPGATVFLHASLCRKVPIQTAQISLRY